MADIGSLPSFLSDVADAIRETSATDEKITPSEFDEKIRNIPKESSGIEKIQKNGIDLEIVNKTVNIELDKSDIGLSNVENTSDMEKPISNLQKKEFEKKADKSEIPDVSNYITAKVDNLENYYSKLEIDNKGFLTSIPDEYITEEELESKNYVTENYVDEKITTNITTGEEFTTNTYIDGKRVYAKRLEGTWGTETSMSLPIGLSGTDFTPLKFEVFVNSSNMSLFSGNTPRNGADTEIFSWWNISGDSIFCSSAGYNRQGAIVTATVFYTKN